MNFQTLTADQHIVSLPMSQAVDEHLALDTRHQARMTWLSWNNTDTYRVYIHRADTELDYWLLHKNDETGSPTWYTNDTLVGDAVMMLLQTIGTEREDLDEYQTTLKFVFSAASDAMLFKLTHGGV